MNKNYTIISDLVKKLEIEDSNLIIVEDSEDTKQATISDLKKSLSGDYKDPSDMKFYSSKKTEELFKGVKRELSTLASSKKVEEIEARLEDIIVSGGNDNTEVVDARKGFKTLNSRLENDIELADDKFMKKVRKVIEGKEIETGNSGYVDIYVSNMSGESADIIFKSKNLYNAEIHERLYAKDEITPIYIYMLNAIIHMQADNVLTIPVKFESSLPKGKYFIFNSIGYDEIFKDKGNIKLAVKNSKDDSAYKEFIYDQSSKFEFEAPKAFDEIIFIFNEENYVEFSSIYFRNFMITTDENAEYQHYHNESINVKNNSYITAYNDNYTISCSDPNAIIRVEYYDNHITADTLKSEIDEMKSVLIDKRDKCGLIENYGEYLFFDNVVCETPTSCRLSYDNDKFMRNGSASLKMTFAEDVEINPTLSMEMKEYIENIDSVSLVFYIDRTDSYYFTSSQPITIYLCSDSYNEPEMVNYLSTTINKNELVQGWNIIKKSINEFQTNGVPNIHGITYTKIKVEKNRGLDNRSMYFNSLIFNQKMKPTVLLAFDGIYEDGVSYTYPYLNTKGIPATILSNNRTTFSKTILETVLNLRAKYDWDLGQYGCNPNKELLTNDDNAREQYLALKTAKEWLNDNLVYNPISYSAPYGNLRPITVPLLKDLGYKIAKTDSVGYCNFFDPKYDFAIPMTLMSNQTTAEEIIEKIQYAIDNECCICLYTNNVTEYGDEASAKKMLLEEVVEFILANKDKITPMTFSGFYDKCNS